MKLPTAVGHPASRAAVRWVFDVLAILVAAASVLPDLLHNGNHSRWAEIVVLVLVAAPLLVRRIWPVPVFGWVLAVGIAAGLWDRHLIAGLALLIALYTVASTRPRRDA